MTERNGEGRYEATDATERRDGEGTTLEEAAAEAIGAGSPEDVPRETFAATTDSLQQTVGRDRPERAATSSRPSTTTTRRRRTS